eukprot:m51a1_g4040 hypothetical protein (519) ;mRNA; f:680177-681733
MSGALNEGKSPHLCRLFGRYDFGRPWMAVAGAVVAMLGLGAQPAWGTLTIFISDPGFLRGCSNTVTIWAFAVAGVMAPVVMFIAEPVQKRLGFCLTSLVGCVIAGLGIILSAFARNIGALIVTFGVVFGGAVGLSYVTCVVAAQRWYPQRRGVVGGLVVASFGASSFMYNLVAKALANPNGMATKAPAGATAEQKAAWEQAFHNEMKRTVPHAFFVMGAIMIFLGLVGSVFVHHPPVEERKPEEAETEKPQEGEVTETNETSASELRVEKKPEPLQEAHSNSNCEVSVETSEPAKAGCELEADVEAQKVLVDMSPKQMVKTPQFWLLFFVITLGVTATVFVLGSFSQFAKADAQFDAPFALVGGLAALSNAAGRIAWGYLADLIDYRRVYVIDLVLLTVLLFTYFETRINVVFWGLWTCLIYACYGGLLSLMPTATADAFGAKWQGINYSIMFCGFALGTLLQALLLTALLDALGTYRALFYIMGALTGAAAFAMIAYKPPGRGRWFALCTTYKRTLN